MANRSNHAKYTEDSQYKYGIGFFRREGAKIKEAVRYCEHCGKDLKNAGRYSWVVHHKDHNRKNNTLENYELLCKACHQKEHECHKKLNVKEWIRTCWFCGESFATKTYNKEFCPECRKIWRNSFKGNYTREEAKPLILARRKCNDYPERE